jgi:hypothetical protein
VALETLASVLQVPLGAAKNMVFKRKGLLELSAADVEERLALLARVVQVGPGSARCVGTVMGRRVQHAACLVFGTYGCVKGRALIWRV